MESINENSSPKVSAIELIGKNLIEVEKEVPLRNFNCLTNVKLTPDFQLPLPSQLTGPVILSPNYAEAMDQLRYLIEAKLITHDTTYFWYTDQDPADVWIHEEGNIRHYKNYYNDWVWAEGDSRESRKEDIFRLRRLFAEDESEVEEIEERIDDCRNQREGDTSVFWLLDYCRHVYDFTRNLPYNRAINYKHRMGMNVVILRGSSSENPELREKGRHGC